MFARMRAGVDLQARQAGVYRRGRASGKGKCGGESRPLGLPGARRALLLVAHPT